jgi:hypothetical protein
MALEYIPEENRKQIKPFGEVDAHRMITMAVGRTYVKKSIADAVSESVLAAAERYYVMNVLYS